MITIKLYLIKNANCIIYANYMRIKYILEIFSVIYNNIIYFIT